MAQALSQISLDKLPPYNLEAEQSVILKLGISERFNDAVIFYFGAEIERLSCVVNYDVNISNLAHLSAVFRFF